MLVGLLHALSEQFAPAVFFWLPCTTFFACHCEPVFAALSATVDLPVRNAGLHRVLTVWTMVCAEYGQTLDNVSTRHCEPVFASLFATVDLPVRNA